MQNAKRYTLYVHYLVRFLRVFLQKVHPMTTGLPAPVPLEIRLLQDELVRIQDTIDNISLSDLPKKYPSGLYQSKKDIKDRIRSLCELQGRSRSVPRRYRSQSNGLASKHRYLISLDPKSLKEFPDSFVYRDSWSCPDSESTLADIPNIHVVKYLQHHCPPPSFIPPPIYCPSTSSWGHPSSFGWDKPKVDLSYRKPLLYHSGWEDPSIQRESWERVRKTLWDIHNNTTFGNWQPILEIIGSYLYHRPYRYFESHYQEIGDHLLVHHYPYTNNYFNNSRIAKRLHNDIDPEQPDQPPPKVRRTYHNFTYKKSPPYHP